MTRSDGSRTADIDVSLLSDPKFRKLGRLLPKAGALSEAVVLYLSTVLESWGAGERVSADDAAPLWMRNHATWAASLQEAELLDADRMLPEKSWDGWYGPANTRREARRLSGRAGGYAKASLQQSSGDATAKPLRSDKQRHGDALPDPLPIRTVPNRSDPAGTREIANGVDRDAMELQALAEELTGQAYVMADLYGGLGLKALDEQLRPHGLAKVTDAWRKVAAQHPSKVTLRQLVLEGDDLLNPLSAPGKRETPAEREDREMRERVAKLNAEAAARRATSGVA